MKKLLSIALVSALLFTMLAMPTSAYNFERGEAAQQGLTWALPSEADGGFELATWNRFDWAEKFGGTKLAGVTAKEAANGRRSFYATFNPDNAAYDKEHGDLVIDNIMYASSTPMDWNTVPITKWSHCNNYFFLSDLKMTSDFVGVVFLQIKAKKAASWEQFIWGSDSTTEFVLFNNTTDAIKCVNFPVGSDNAADYADWKRTKSKTLLGEEDIKKLLEETKTNENGGTFLSIGVRTFSGTVWVDNIDIWNNGEYTYDDEATGGNHLYPEYTPDPEGVEIDDGSILLGTGFESDTTDVFTEFQYNEGDAAYKEANGISITNDPENVYKGNGALQVEHMPYYGGSTDANAQSGHSRLLLGMWIDKTNKIDISTTYHIEIAMKGTADALANPRITVSDSRTNLMQTIHNGEFAFNTPVQFGHGPIDTEWEIYNTPSFTLTGGYLEFKLWVINTSGTVWYDDIRLVPDRLSETHGKVTGAYNETTQEYTIITTADEGYQLKDITIGLKNDDTFSLEPTLVEKIDVNTTKFTWNKADATGISGYNYVKYNFKFTPVNYLLFDMGDAKNDYSIDMLDLIYAKKYALQDIDYANGEDINLHAIDYDKNGLVDITDIFTLRKGLFDNMFIEE